MRSLSVIPLLALAGAAHALAGPLPCVSGTAADYAALASGCTVGGLTFSDFTIVDGDPAADRVDAAAVAITPILDGQTSTLRFGMLIRSMADQFREFSLTFAVTGGGIRSAGLRLVGASAADDGVALALQQLCLGTGFVAGACGAGSADQAVFAVDGDQELTALTRFTPPLGLAGVRLDLSTDGGPFGSAALDAVDASFSVPEPGGFAMLSLAVVAFALSRRPHVRFAQPKNNKETV